MQVYLPLNTPATYEETRAFSSGLAQLLERRDPDLVVSEMTKAKRGGKVFVDWSQNASFKTTVNVYSLRAMERPTVSTPLTWDEVSDDRGRRARWRSRRTRCSRASDELGDLFAACRRSNRSCRADAPDRGRGRRLRRACARRGALAKAGGAQITLIDRTNHFVFQPLLYQVATGLLSGGQISPALRGIFRKFPHVRVLLGEVDGLRPRASGRAALRRARVRAGIRHAGRWPRARRTPTSGATTGRCWRPG